MIRIFNFDSLSPEDILNRDIRAEEDVNAAVDAILADVRKRGDEALRGYTERFDGVKLENFQVTEEEVEAAWDALDGDFRTTLEMAADNIRRFHEQQVHKDSFWRIGRGLSWASGTPPLRRWVSACPGAPPPFPPPS